MPECNGEPKCPHPKTLSVKLPMVERERYSRTRGLPQFITAAMMVTTFLCVASQGQQFEPPTLLKGTTDAEIWVGMLPAQHDGTTSFNTDFWMGGVQFGRILMTPHGPGPLHGSLQWSLNAIPLFIVSNLQSTYGAELDPVVLRWNFAHKGKMTPYFDMAGGLALTNAKVPVGDTSKFNVVAKVGLGWQIFSREQNSIDLGVHAWHLSNAWTASRNPSANGVQLTVGYHWFRIRHAKAADRRETDKKGTP